MNIKMTVHKQFYCGKLGTRSVANLLAASEGYYKLSKCCIYFIWDFNIFYSTEILIAVLANEDLLYRQAAQMLICV